MTAISFPANGTFVEQKEYLDNHLQSVIIKKFDPAMKLLEENPMKADVSHVLKGKATVYHHDLNQGGKTTQDGLQLATYSIFKRKYDATSKKNNIEINSTFLKKKDETIKIKFNKNGIPTFYLQKNKFSEITKDLDVNKNKFIIKIEDNDSEYYSIKSNFK